MATVAMETISIRNDKIFIVRLVPKWLKKIIGIVFRTNEANYQNGCRLNGKIHSKCLTFHVKC